MPKILLRHQVDKIRSEIVEIEENLARRLIAERKDYEIYEKPMESNIKAKIKSVERQIKKKGEVNKEEV